MRVSTHQEWWDSGLETATHGAPFSLSIVLFLQRRDGASVAHKMTCKTDEAWVEAERTSVRVPPLLPKHSHRPKPLEFLMGKVPTHLLVSTPRRLHLMLFLLAGFARLGDRSGTFRLRTQDLGRFGWTPTTWRRQLKQLEDLELISVYRRAGCTPVITLTAELRPG